VSGNPDITELLNACITSHNNENYLVIMGSAICLKHQCNCNHTVPMPTSTIMSK